MKPEELPDLIVDYIRRAPSTICHVESHFCLTHQQAHDALIDLAHRWLIKISGLYWTIAR